MNLKKLREKSGFTQQEVADKLGIVVRTVYSWEAGITEPKKSTMDRLVRILEKGMKNGR